LRRGGRRDLGRRWKSLYDTTASLEFPNCAFGAISNLTPSLQKRMLALPSKASERGLDTYTAESTLLLANVCFIRVPDLEHHGTETNSHPVFAQNTNITNVSRTSNIGEASQERRCYCSNGPFGL
jgi:hypothetical protein